MWVCGGTVAIIVALVSYIFIELKVRVKNLYGHVHSLKDGQVNLKSELLAMSMKMDFLIKVLENGSSKKILKNIADSKAKFK